MTSNIGSTYILEHARGDWEQVETQVMETLRQNFKPEFLNRVDDIIIFRPLGKEEIEQIVDLQLERVERLLAERKITLEVTPEAKRVLGREGYDPAYGARPLKRAIQRLMQNPLAMAVLEGKFSEGDTIVVRPDGKGAIGVLERTGEGDRRRVRPSPTRPSFAAAAGRVGTRGQRRPEPSAGRCAGHRREASEDRSGAFGSPRGPSRLHAFATRALANGRPRVRSRQNG